MMMNDSHFYLTLPSNASQGIFPDNKTTGYRVKLPQSVDLEGDWEVGLFSISYPHSWYTITYQNHENVFYFNYGQPKPFLFSATMRPGYYDSTGKLIEAANQGIQERRCPPEKIRLTYDSTTRKTTFHLAKNCYVALYHKLSHVLGFKNDYMLIEKTTESPYVVDLALTSSIYIYCDIVEPQVVGDTNAKLLRTIPVQRQIGDDVYVSFTNIMYVPVQTKSFEDIQILLRTDTGEPVPFERGKVVVTLQFRKHTYFT